MATRDVWIYDLRTNIENINKGNPLNRTLFEDFEINYHLNPRKENERFRKYTKSDIEIRDYNLNIFWLKDNSSVDYANLPDPIDLACDVAQHLETALDSVNRLLVELGNCNKIM